MELVLFTATYNLLVFCDASFLIISGRKRQLWELKGVLKASPYNMPHDFLIATYKIAAIENRNFDDLLTNPQV
jgi:hypothetical protein